MSLLNQNEEKPLISVIVPVYNGEDYLENCVISIENQTYRNLEVIIINDGSTDGTAAVCVKLNKRYENIRVITMEDEGVSSARNAGIDVANGEFIAFVDADDRLRPKLLQVLYENLLSTDSDVSGCRFLTFQDEKGWISLLQNKYHLDKPRTYGPSAYLKQEILKGNSRCWSKLYRRQAIGDVRFHKDLTIGEDMLFLVELLPSVNKFAETDYPGYGYFQNPEGAMNREFTPKYMDQITCWELAREEALKIDKKAETRMTTILLMAIMLVTGKIALLPASERREQKQYTQICMEKLKKELQVPGAFEGLSENYKKKVNFFQDFPSIYFAVYHLRKYLI